MKLKAGLNAKQKVFLKKLEKLLLDHEITSFKFDMYFKDQVTYENELPVVRGRLITNVRFHRKPKEPDAYLWCYYSKGIELKFKNKKELAKEGGIVRKKEYVL